MSSGEGREFIQAGSQALAANPWPGLASYTEKDQELFFGRERETAELLRLIERESLTVLFGRSGLGKTSLLRAGVIPKLRNRSYFPIVLRLDYSGTGIDPVEQVKALIGEAGRSSGIDVVDSAPRAEPKATLWEYFHTVEFWGPRNDPFTPVLLFDQFEEVFTIGRDIRATSEFLEQLADLVENRVPRIVRERIKEADEHFSIDTGSRNYKIVLSLRDDFVSRLDSLRPLMPAVMRNRLALDPLDSERALAVIDAGREWVDGDVAQDIVSAVAGRGERKDDPAAPSESHIEIEPAYLSVMCHELFRRMLATGSKTITRDLVAQESGGILEGLYERSFEGLQSEARLFVEERLVTASGFRMAVPLAESIAEHVSPRELDTLVDRRLLRFEDRLGARYVELSHDLLTHVVQKSRDERRLAESRVAEANQRDELRRKLIRSRKRTALSAALAVLFLAVLVAAYFGYFHEFTIYSADYRKRLGVFEPITSISSDAVKHRVWTLKFTRQGFKPFGGRILAMQAIDSSGQCTTRHTIGTYLRGVDDQKPEGLKECRWELVYNAKGEVTYEIAMSPLGKMVWGFVYSPSSQSKVRRAMFVGPDGYPQPQGKSSAEYVEITYNSKGYEEKRRYMTREGRPAPGPDRAFGTSSEYDQLGRPRTITSLDIDGSPMNDAAGNASMLREFFDNGNLRSWTALDKRRQPTMLTDAQVVNYKYSYDEWGNRIEGRVYDEAGRPVTETNWEASIFRNTYDSRGNRIESRYFDSGDRPVGPFHLIKNAYDERNRLISTSYFDASDNPTLRAKTWHEVRYSYDANGFVEQTSYFDRKNQPVETQDGYHRVESRNDDYGRSLEQRFYGADSRPVKADRHECVIRYSHDERGYVTQETRLDCAEDGKPVPGERYIFRAEMRYDRFGNRILVEGYNSRGDRVSNRAGFHRRESTFDDFGHIVSMRYFDTTLRPFAVEGVHETRRSYNAHGLLTEEKNFDTNGEPVEREGIFLVVFEYNDKQQEISRQYFGINKRVAANRDGIHLQLQEYDQVGRRVSLKKFDRDGRAIQ